MAFRFQYIEMILFFVFLTFVTCDDTGELLMANVVSRHTLYYFLLLNNLFLFWKNKSICIFLMSNEFD